MEMLVLKPDCQLPKPTGHMVVLLLGTGADGLRGGSTMSRSHLILEHAPRVEIVDLDQEPTTVQRVICHSDLAIAGTAASFNHAFFHLTA
jgi:hypothetical protein